MNPKILYKEWLEQWLQDKREFVKEATYANYSTAIVNQIIPTLGDYHLSELTEKKLQETALYWLDQGRMDKGGGLSDKTVKDLIMIVKLSLRAAAKAKLMTQRSTEILFPKAEKTDKLKVFSKDDQLKLTQMVYLNLTPKNAGVLFCLHTGVRIGELCAVQWKDIDLERKTVTISKTVQRIYIKDFDGTSQSKLLITTPKTKASFREIPLSSALYPVLKKMNPMNPELYLLTGTEKFTEPRTFRGFYDRLLRRMDIEHINFHGLRHTFATRLIEGGADYKTVSELLGHASVNMTLNLYVHPQMEQKRKAVEIITDFL
jgi:integrase